MIEAISRIQTMTVEEILGSAETIQAEINDMYLEYEIANRQQLIDKVYDPTEENKSEIVITDLSQMGEGALLHFFNPGKKPEKEDSYLKLVKQRIEQRSGKNYIGEEEELKIAKKQYEVMSNNMVTNYTVPFTGDTVGQVGTFEDRYISSVENQISALVATPEQMMKGIGIRGKLALGFSKKTLSPEMIALLAAKNVYANKGINFIESENDFEDFSVPYSELLGGNSNEKGNEVVLFRNTDISTLKPAYVLYIATEKLDSNKEKEELDNIRNMMRDIGLDVPLCILDTYTIKEKQKQIEEQEGRL